MIALPWSCVTALKLEPVGPISAGCFGLRYLGSGWDDTVDITWQGARYIECSDYRAAYRIVDPHKVRQTRDALGSLVDSPTGLRRPEKYPWFTMLCELQRGLTG